MTRRLIFCPLQIKGVNYRNLEPTLRGVAQKMAGAIDGFQFAVPFRKLSVNALHDNMVGLWGERKEGGFIERGKING